MVADAPHRPPVRSRVRATSARSSAFTSAEIRVSSRTFRAPIFARGSLPPPRRSLGSSFPVPASGARSDDPSRRVASGGRPAAPPACPPSPRATSGRTSRRPAAGRRSASATVVLGWRASSRILSLVRGQLPPLLPLRCHRLSSFPGTPPDQGRGITLSEHPKDRFPLNHYMSVSRFSDPVRSASVIVADHSSTIDGGAMTSANSCKDRMEKPAVGRPQTKYAFSFKGGSAQRLSGQRPCASAALNRLKPYRSFVAGHPAWEFSRLKPIPGFPL